MTSVSGVATRTILVTLLTLAVVAAVQPLGTSGRASAVPAIPDTTTRVNVDSDEVEADAGLPPYYGEYGGSASADGRFVAFLSGATNLVADDTNGKGDIFVRDVESGTTVRASVSDAEAQADGTSDAQCISADGNLVFFTSEWDGFVQGDTGSVNDVFVRDLNAQTTTRAVMGHDGSQPNGNCYGPVVTADGRYVVFASVATNIVAGDSNGRRDLFRRDLVTGDNVMVTPAGTEELDLNGYDVSDDGRYVVFGSSASDLVAGDSNDASDVFVRDLQAGSTTRISVGASGAQIAAHSYIRNGCMSADGQRIAFSTTASLTPLDANVYEDVYVRDRAKAETRLVSGGMGGAPTDNSAGYGGLSPDGNHAVFISNATNVVPNDLNGKDDVFVRDLWSGEVVRVSVGSSGEEANDHALPCAVGDGGAWTLFESSATNLVPSDGNSAKDLFMRRRDVPPATRLAAVPALPAGAWAKTNVSITLSANDFGGTGVEATYYRLSGATSTDQITYANAPFVITNQGMTTVEYWSVDTAAKEELPHRTAVIRVDKTPPVTTSDAKASYDGAAAIKLMATDTGGSGVAKTEWRLNGGTWKLGTSVTIGAPGTHKLEYRSQDAAGNLEVAKATVFTVWSTTTLTLVGPSLNPAYNSTVRLAARLVTSKGTPLAHRAVTFDRWSGSSWIPIGTISTGSTGYVVTYASGIRTRTLYRARFAQTSPYRFSKSATLAVLPKARLTRKTSWSSLSLNKTYTAKGFIEPRHLTGDANKVRIRAYKKASNGKYYYKRSFTASYAFYSASKTSYAAKVRLTSKGTWKLVAYHAADSRNAATSGIGDVLVVK